MSPNKKLNYIKPFQIESSLLRGRVAHMDSVLDEILTAHDYPKPIAHLVAEMAALALLLSSMLKYKGIFTLQARGDGAVSMLVADVTSDGGVRACASFDPDRLERSREALSALKTPEGSQNHLAQYLGQGHMMFTVDHTEGQGDRYQGIVALEGASLVDCVQHYFTQSEQIKTGIKIAIGQREDQWRARGIMLQRMPEDDGNNEDSADKSNISEDDWRRAMVLMGSCTEDEFLDPDLTSDELLYRLYHEDGVRIYDTQDIQKECRCSLERVQNVITTLPDEDRTYLIKDGAIEVKCEFCSKIYRLDPETNEEL